MEGGAIKKKSKPAVKKSKPAKHSSHTTKSTTKKPAHKVRRHADESGAGRPRIHNLAPSELREKTVIQLRQIAKSKGVPQSHNGKPYDKDSLVKVIAKH